MSAISVEDKQIIRNVFTMVAEGYSPTKSNCLFVEILERYHIPLLEKAQQRNGVKYSVHHSLIFYTAGERAELKQIEIVLNSEDGGEAQQAEQRCMQLQVLFLQRLLLAAGDSVNDEDVKFTEEGDLPFEFSIQTRYTCIFNGNLIKYRGAKFRSQRLVQ